MLNMCILCRLFWRTILTCITDRINAFSFYLAVLFSLFISIIFSHNLFNVVHTWPLFICVMVTFLTLHTVGCFVFDVHLTMLERAIAKGIRPSVCPSVTLMIMPKRFKISICILHHTMGRCFYFLVAVFGGPECKGSPWTSVLKRGIPRRKCK